MRIVLQNDWWWTEEHGVDAGGRLYLGSRNHTCPWMPRIPVKAFSVRFPDKLWHVGVTAALALWIGSVWAFAIMTVIVEFLFMWAYDPSIPVRIGIWDTMANLAGAVIGGLVA